MDNDRWLCDKHGEISGTMYFQSSDGEKKPVRYYCGLCYEQMLVDNGLKDLASTGHKSRNQRGNENLSAALEAENEYNAQERKKQGGGNE